MSLFFSAFLIWWVSFGADDLLRTIMTPSIDTENIIDMWENVKTVGRHVFEGTLGSSVGGDGAKVWTSPSLIVKATRLLLILVITLSVTMILYNWMIYIIETWNGKQWKNLITNVVYIVVWILLSLFSVVIITLIQSVPSTIDAELKRESNNVTDNNVIEWKRIPFKEIFKKF